MRSLYLKLIDVAVNESSKNRRKLLLTAAFAESWLEYVNKQWLLKNLILPQLNELVAEKRRYMRRKYFIASRGKLMD